MCHIWLVRFSLSLTGTCIGITRMYFVALFPFSIHVHKPAPCKQNFRKIGKQEQQTNKNDVTPLNLFVLRIHQPIRSITINLKDQITVCYISCSKSPIFLEPEPTPGLED